MSLIDWILLPVFGLIVGAIARFLIPGRQSMGLLATAILGIVGSLVGGFLGSLLFDAGDGLNFAGWIGSVIGAVVVLLVYIFATKKS